MAICENENIPVRFFEKHLDKICWDRLSSNSRIPLSFFRKHNDKVNFKKLAGIALKIYNDSSVSSSLKSYVGVADFESKPSSLGTSESFNKTLKYIRSLGLSEATKRT